MKSKLALYSSDCETRVEIALPDSESLTIMIGGIALDGKFCTVDIEAEAIPEIIDYLQRAWTEYCNKKPPTEKVG